AHAALRSQAASRHPEFLQCVGEGQRKTRGVLRIVVNRAVERIGHAELQAAGDGDVDATLEVAAVRPTRLHGRTGEHDQIRDLAPLQWQLHNAFLFDDGADAGTADVNERCGRFNRYRLFEVAHREHGVDRRPRV